MAVLLLERSLRRFLEFFVEGCTVLAMHPKSPSVVLVAKPDAQPVLFRPAPAACAEDNVVPLKPCLRMADKTLFTLLNHICVPTAPALL